MQTIRHNINAVKISLLTIIALGISIFCQAQNLPFVSALSKTGLKEARLGSSNYYLLLPVILPDTFRIVEAHGIEGQLGYHFTFKDSSLLKTFFIEISRGQPVGGTLHDSTKGELFAQSSLADKIVRWRITKTESNFYQVFTAEGGNLNAHFSCKAKTDINYLISIIATLKQK